ncbi:hypothetical protein LASUN_26600 [Lentilactobacillus sunkii]|uniref:Uncharacterized protein n=1 Tax=Lentilactobacillus sunkii TaxID=481719 RepID=A0A1E7X8D4_9LACO|nr:hypothetical protein [Lentilactobacillus sunkii]OFA09393.1 hypothetical protein LASUN_26600 [Lentilactobacillus sunkii]
MNLYIMLIFAALGLFVLFYGWRQKNRPAVRVVFIIFGILLLIFAGITATPQGTEILSHMI